MFEYFSFDAASRHPSSLPLRHNDLYSPALSPTSSCFASPTMLDEGHHQADLPITDLSITELSQRFSQQKLCNDSGHFTTSPLHEPASLADDVSDALGHLPRPSRPSYSRGSTYSPRPYSPSARSRRQVNVRLQCDDSHLRDIRALVARMVSNEEQCALFVSPSPTESVSSTSSEQEDEGYDSLSEGDARRDSGLVRGSHLAYRRSGNGIPLNASVSKSARQRRTAKRISRV
ncbi:hypothetical protein LTR66_001102 [Elasticomyces elasticus]|nr:hypothetical protein LTR28_006871 [Elasticomyces elasticus]KAK4999970.1 hypothetical protein LTR66_001102 [Elasticomyces elasticus]